ncbi:MAG: Gfo/Idh/MocA family oxidoreductase [Sporolactobacillus sp.]
MKTYNWGMIGTGWIAHEMADALNSVNGEIYAVADVNEAALKAFSEEKKIQRTFTNPDDLLKDPNVDIVYIATPHNFHYEYIMKALEAGKNVFAEKAITVNSRQLSNVRHLAAEKGLIVTEGLTLFHMPLYKKVKQLISDGKIGDVNLVQVNFGSLKDYDVKNRFFNKNLAGGALLDIGGYATAFARSFLKTQPVNVLTTVKYFETGVDEQSGILLKNLDDQIAVLSLSMRAKQPKRGVISGTKGYIEISNYPRATEAAITYTDDAHTESHEVITAGDASLALQYEVQDMQRYIEQGHDDGEFALSFDIMDILTNVRNQWGMKYPFDRTDY